MAATAPLLVQPLKVCFCAALLLMHRCRRLAGNPWCRTQTPWPTPLIKPSTPTPTPTQELCIRAVSSGFEQQRTFGQLPDTSCTRIIEGLSLDLPLELVGTVGW